MSIWRWLRIFSNDAGFLVRDGKQLRWPRAKFPVDVTMTAAAADAFAPLIDEAMFEYNRKVGRNLFLPAPVRAHQVLLDAFADEGKRAYLRGMVLVDIDVSDDDDHGRTDLRWDRRTGEIINAIVTIPAGCPPELLRRVIGHELGHVLALEHDRHPGSIMWPKASERGGELVAADVKRLRRAYG